MSILDVLKLPSFTGASMVAGYGADMEEITGIMVLEALDIEDWTHPGEIILSSFFAMDDLSSDTLEAFVQKLANLRIAALAIKLDRLLTHIPESLITYCNKYFVPLIQLPKGVSYETLILEVLTPIINANSAALNQYYSVHQKLARLVLKEPTASHLLQELRQLINQDISLAMARKKNIYGTNPERNHFTIVRTEVIKATKSQIFTYYNYDITYDRDPSCQVFSCMGVSIPNIMQEVSMLYIHAPAQLLMENFFPIIENFVFFLQIELLKQAAVKRSLFFQTNEVVHNLLEQRYEESKLVDQYLSQLNLARYPYYQVVSFRSMLEEPVSSQNLYDVPLMQNFFQVLKKEFTALCPLNSNEARGSRQAFICNLPSISKKITTAQVKELMHRVQTLLPDKELSYYVAISTIKGKLELSSGNQETLDVHQIQVLRGAEHEISSYEELGLYHMFLKSDVLQSPEMLVSPDFLQFCNEQPVLAKTLQTYLDLNQNTSATAHALYLHPKTISYRIEKIRKLLHFQFQDPEQVLQAQIAFRALNIMQH